MGGPARGAGPRVWSGGGAQNRAQGIRTSRRHGSRHKCSEDSLPDRWGRATRCMLGDKPLAGGCKLGERRVHGGE